jgi:hypothetical protein
VCSILYGKTTISKIRRKNYENKKRARRTAKIKSGKKILERKMAGNCQNEKQCVIAPKKWAGEFHKDMYVTVYLSRMRKPKVVYKHSPRGRTGEMLMK